jgi:hypothetical protein
MTATADQPEATVSSNSRRAVLIGALSGLGAWAAGAVTGVARVRAADDEPILVGGEYTASTVTKLTNSSNGNRVFEAGSTGEGTAIVAESNLGTGLFANCGAGVAVNANTNGLEAVLAHSDSSTAAAIKASQNSGDGNLTGVLGISGPSHPPVRAKTGVHGYAAQDSGSRGVIGESPAGHGVRGETQTGSAVFGSADSGYALRGSGRVRFDRVSGVARLAAGSTSKTITPGVDVTSSSFVLLTPKTDIGTRSLWFTTNPTTNTITIRMSSSRTRATDIAWLLVG